jgi:putative FmdB family regulatory protein
MAGMPTYQYSCEKCGQEFEKYQSIADKPLAVCPKDLCGRKTWGKGKVKRMIGAGAGLIFKGSGFYTTDYRSDKYKEAAKKDSSSSSSSPTASGSSDSKPAPAKADSKPAATPKAKE